LYLIHTRGIRLIKRTKIVPLIKLIQDGSYSGPINIQFSIMEIRKTLCIPRVENGLCVEYIKQKFEKWNIGKVVNITEIPLHMDPSHKRVMVDMYINTKHTNSAYVLDRFEQGQNVKLVHNNPWFWKMVVAR